MHLSKVVLLLFPLSAAHRGRPTTRAGGLPPLHRASLASIPVRMYADDCWKRRPSHRVALEQQGAQAETQLPGAGMNPESITPFQTVLKDGFFEVACGKDFLLNHGDKFGDGKDTYTLGDVSNVSIVHYTSMVVKEDREAMTQEVCFKFCRTVPDMLTFGIHNGRDCYCAPYFKPMESDSTSCDAVCDGNPTQMCGGKFKSSVFEMHSCADTSAELKEANEKATTVMTVLGDSIKALETVASGMQKSAETLQSAFGAVGDPSASDLMQDAKVTAGKLEEAAGASKKVETALKDSTAEAKAVTLSGPSLEAIAKAEALQATLEKLTAEAEDNAESLDAQTKAACPSGSEFNASDNTSKQYYPLMYFVDKSFVNMPSTCTGKPVLKPMAAVTLDECAYACDTQIHDCVGFSFYPTDFHGSSSLCFLFSKFTEVTYYTGCNAAMLLKLRGASQAAEEVGCMAKLSKFDGTFVKPDPSGKCPGCLKKATKAARCPQIAM